MKKLLKSIITGVVVGLLLSPPLSPVSADVTGHYTDLLPNPTSAGTNPGTLFYNGYDWQLALTGPSTGPGDAVARTGYVTYQSTSIAIISGTTAQSTFTATSFMPGFRGSTAIQPQWFIPGRTIEIDMRGYYTTNGAVESWTWAIVLGTNSIVGQTGTTVSGEIKQPWHANALITIVSTGTTGSALANFDIGFSSGAVGTPKLDFSSTTANAITINTLTDTTVVPRFNWATTVSSIGVTNVSIRLWN